MPMFDQDEPSSHAMQILQSSTIPTFDSSRVVAEMQYMQGWYRRICG